MKLRDKYLGEALTFPPKPAAGAKSKVMDILMDIGYGGEAISDAAAQNFGNFADGKLTIPEIENVLKTILKDARDIATQATQAMAQLKKMR